MLERVYFRSYRTSSQTNVGLAWSTHSGVNSIPADPKAILEGARSTDSTHFLKYNCEYMILF